MSLSNLYQSEAFQSARQCLYVDMTPHEDQLFDSIMDLMTELPHDVNECLPLGLYERLIMLTVEAQLALRNHPTYTAKNLLHLGRVMLEYLHEHRGQLASDEETEILKYLDSIVYVVDFITQSLGVAKLTKYDQTCYPIQVTADCMFHLKELLDV